MSVTPGAIYPAWITLPYLGTFNEIYSFNLNPLYISFAASSKATISVINGQLPSGLNWTRTGSNIVVTGQSIDIATDKQSSITWRLTNPNGEVADRTFHLSLTPIVNPPSWIGQAPFLGYASSGKISTYHVTATTGSRLGIKYSFAQFTPPAGMSIDENTGIITFSAPIVSSSSTLSFAIKATSGTLSSNITCFITLLTVPHAPAWITKQGLIATISQGQFLEYSLSAYESSGSTVTYTLVSSTPTLPFTLASDGLMYGHAPTVFEDTVYVFKIAAHSIHGTGYRTFEIQANAATVNAPLSWTNRSSDLGVYLDGQYVIIDVSAASIHDQINYSVVGGILPPDLTIDRHNGKLLGFLEFHATARDYYFDIQVSDGFETLIRQYKLGVDRRISHQYMDVELPIQGPIRTLHRNYQTALANPAWVIDQQYLPEDRLEHAYIELASGLDYSIDNVNLVVQAANLHLHSTNLMIGATQNSNVSTSSIIFYNEILDSQAGAEAAIAINGPLLFNGSATCSPHYGTVVFAVDVSSKHSSVIPGTVLRATSQSDPDVWLEGPVNAYSGYQLSINSTHISGTDTSSAWEIGYAPNYPASLVNIRQDIIAKCGWVTAGRGRAAELIPDIDPISGYILSITVSHPGSNYLTSPPVRIVGEGAGAAAIANLAVNGVTVTHPGNHWSIGDRITLTVPATRPAVLSVEAVDSIGGIRTISILDGGEYDHFPTGDITVTHAAGLESKLHISMGIGHVRMTSFGSGYLFGTTAIDISGYEQLPAWQTAWMPYIPVVTVNTDKHIAVFNRQTTANNQPYYYQRWPLKHMILSLQGINWTGDTSFDKESFSLDGGSTRFPEWTEPKDTLIDSMLPEWERADRSYWQSMAYRAWGATQFDEHKTIMDLYSTILDELPVTSQSVTNLRRIIRVVSPQVSGHNEVS
jgi:hypothetical protein